MPMENVPPILSKASARMGVALLAALLAGSPAAVNAQASADASTDGSSGIHFLVGGFVGRFDLDGGGRTDLFGGRVGVGLRELVQITGFYWRGFDRSGDSITADNAWGGELQLNLNTGFGITPFVTGGVARVHQDGNADQTAAIAGAGLTFPLGPVLLHAAARDYMFGVTGLEDENSPEDVTHNWLYSAGVKFAIGSRRRTPTLAAAPPPPAADRPAPRDANAELAALRDSLLAADGAPADAAAVRARVAALDSLITPRNYHSGQRIEIPIPTEGSITLRYGPDRPAPAAPLVVTMPATIAAPGASAAGQAAATPASPVLPAPPGATLDDPATQEWLRQVVAGQVADQLARRPAAAASLTQAQLDALAQRVLDGVIASVVPRLDAAQDLRMNELRADLRIALMDPRVDAPASLVRREATAAAPPQPSGPPPSPTPPIPAAPAADVAAASAAEDRERARAEAALAAMRAEAAQRAALAGVVATYPRYLTGAETERGPAAVLGDAAFESGAALVSSTARTAVAAVAEVLRAHPDRRIYIQGHTDGVGGELQNQRLSELRAEAVRSLLVQDGVEADRLFAVGYGQARPVADNATPRGRALNRRVEIVIGESHAVAAR
jgi:outer membrane protein OmpA-like peptidoglycan-associated protein